MPSELILPFKQAADYTPGRSAQIRLIVIHSMEAAETGQTAEGCQNYFATPSQGMVGSTHVCVDNDSAVRSVHDWDTPWGAPMINSDGLHVEQAGYAAQSPTEWNDNYSSWMISQQTARICADWALRYNIPLVRLQGAALRDRTRRGFCTHNDATQAWNVSNGHTDPGVNYPWALLMEWTAKWVAQYSKTPTVVVRNPYSYPTRLLYLAAPWLTGNDVRYVQWALGIPVDGIYGTQTDAAVRSFQRRNSLGVDGVVGSSTLSRLALITH